MTLLPNVELATIPRSKIRDYLLESSHPEGGSKAAFFLALGFQPERWQLLANALRAMILRTPITRTVAGRHGTKYIVEGKLMTPAARTVCLRSVWIIDPGESAPRFVTAYPLDA